MEIKKILDEIASESSTKLKEKILGSYADNKLLERVLYLAKSKRVKFYIKQIPEYTADNDQPQNLEWALDGLDKLSTRYFTGHEATKWLQVLLSGISDDNAYVIIRIIEKDLKIGMGATIINKVFPSLVEKTPYMGCVPFDPDKAKNIFFDPKSKKVTNLNLGISEIKADGRYCNVIVRGGEVELESRQGEPTILGECTLLTEFAKLDDCVLNGELVMEGVPRHESNGIIMSLIDIHSKMDSRTKAESDKKIKAFEEEHMTIEKALNLIKIKVWDILSVDDYFAKVSSIGRMDRLNKLINTITSDFTSIEIVEYKIVASYEEAIAHFVEALERGEEGTVLKSFDGVWKNGKPTYQIKMKVEFDLDLKIVGFNYGGVGTKNEFVISSVACESSCGKLTANAQGIKEAQMAFITENQDKLLGTIAKVKCNGLSSNKSGGNSVLYPVLKELRDDKLEANSFDECFEIDLGAKGLKNEIK